VGVLLFVEGELREKRDGMTRISEELCIFDKNEWKQLVEELALSPRQKEIVQHLLLGQSDKQIAAAMGLAQPTVRTHLSRLFARLNVQDRQELVLQVFHHFRSGCRAVDCPRQQLHQDCRLAKVKINEDNVK
jgi:DNA-binding CsgD family transcriptional regulator